MLIENYTNHNSEYLSGSNYKWHYMLLELLDQPVDKDLADWGQTGQYNNVNQERRVFVCELISALQLASG